MKVPVPGTYSEASSSLCFLERACLHAGGQAAVWERLPEASHLCHVAYPSGYLMSSAGCPQGEAGKACGEQGEDTGP